MRCNHEVVAVVDCEGYRGPSWTGRFPIQGNCQGGSPVVERDTVDSPARVPAKKQPLCPRSSRSAAQERPQWKTGLGDRLEQGSRGIVAGSIESVAGSVIGSRLRFNSA